MKRITGRLTEKNSKWYAVINLYNENGERKQKWISLDLEAKRGNKTEANFRLNEILTKYNSGEFHIESVISRAEEARVAKSEKTLSEYMTEWLQNYKCNISVLTYNSYKNMIEARIVPYFEKTNITLKNITGDEINDFYIHLRENGLSGTSAQRYHALLHLAFKHAVKRKVIPTNPCEQADRPKSTPYIGTYYNSVEIMKLLECLDGDPMRIAVILAAYYGLRRSEVIGLKWDAIDWVENKIYIRHKVIENKLEGYKVQGFDVMKTKASYRSLPLIPCVAEILRQEKAKQEDMKRMLRGKYNQTYKDYICVDALGNILRPRYVTDHFAVILRKNGLKQIRFHDLRHSCASLLLANKVPMKMIQEWLGHSDMSTTANIYSHTDFTSKIESANVIGSILKFN